MSILDFNKYGFEPQEITAAGLYVVWGIGFILVEIRGKIIS